MLQPIKFVSLILVVASALVLGLSTGLVAGMIEVNKATAEINQNSIIAVQEKNEPASRPLAAADNNSAFKTNSTENFSAQTTTLPDDLSGADIAQVESMLEILGYNTRGGLVPAVQKYQQDNALNATGALDIDTIQSMVNKVRINRINNIAVKTTS